MEKTKVFVLLCGLVAALALWQCDAAALDNEDEEDSLLVRGLGSLGSLGTSLLGGSGPLGMIGSVLSGGGTATPAQKCNTNCPAPTGPDCAVCACCGGTDRTFDTQCCLESWNCQNPSSQCTFKSNGKCPPPCDNNCAGTGTPVCATCAGKRQQFSTLCDLKYRNCSQPTNSCTYLCDGLCPPNCDNNCSTTGQQGVCATCYGVDVNLSYCNFTIANCKNPGSCVLKNNGTCAPPCSQFNCPTTPSYVCANCSGLSMTFNTECDMNKYNCNFKQNCTKVCEGQCAPQCDINCATTGQQPVCATCNGVDVNLSYCNFTIANCKNPGSCIFKNNGTCAPPCSQFNCPTTPSYVCANCSGVSMTFNTECDMNKYNCNFKQNCSKVCDGKCAPQCDINCSTTGQQPVCATCNGVDVNLSYCNFTIANCNNPGSCIFKNNGTCAPPCSQFNCPTTPSYVCANCSGVSMTFNTECDMNKYNCNFKQNCSKVCDGKCAPQCDINCSTTGQQPVCATCNGVDVNLNYCNFTIANCNNPGSCIFKNNGTCAPPCSQFNCPTTPSYVCANCSGVSMTFNTECDMNKYNCNFKQNCSKVCDGKCAPQCDINCSTTGQQPVCATCNGVDVNLSYCNFTIANCNNPGSCIFKNNGTCAPPCSQFNCPTTPSYVCANCSGVSMTFNTECDMNKYNCNFKQNCSKVCDGKCAPQCDINCSTTGQQPVCATCNGVDVNLSYCNFTIANCNNPGSCIFKNNGTCAPPCSQFNCPTTPSYVCANCSGVSMTFNTECDMNKYNCNFKQNCSKVCDGKCAPQCDINCSTTGQQPVCATCNGVDVNLSYCNFTIANCNNPGSCIFKNNGTCAPPCSQFNCPTTPSYVCANCSGVSMTFNTECDMNKYNCNFKQNCTKVCDGKCAPQCDINCSTTGQQPVCATCNGVDVNLSYCNFTIANCNNPGSCVLKNNGTCAPPCSQFNCPTTPSYVCANCSGLSMTFNTECDMNKYNCNFKQNCTKVCEGQCAPQCDINCATTGQQPVCATCNGVDVNLSYCNFTIANCKNPGSCIFKNNGTCAPPCSQPTCPTTPSYICAQCCNGNMTFNTECDMNKFNCQFKTNCTKSYDGKCKPVCPEICPLYVDRVCGSCEGKPSWYSNQCFLNIALCKNPDTCKQVPNSECCNQFCPAIYKPVCGRCNGKTSLYPNQCILDIEICKNPTTCEKVPDSYCCPTSCPANSPTICAKCNGVVQNITQCQYDIKNCNQANTCVKVSDNACPTPCATSCPPNSPLICAKCNGVVQNITQCQYDIKNCNQANTCVKVSDKACPIPCATTCPPNSPTICAKCNGVVQNITQCQYDIKNCNQANTCVKVSDNACPTPCATSCPPNSPLICAKCNGVVQNITQCQHDIKNCNQANTCVKVSDKACPTPCATTCPPNSPTICAKCNGVVQNITQCQYDIKNCNQANTCVKVSDNACPTPCATSCPPNSPLICAKCNGVVQNITQCQYDIKNCNQANTCVKVSDKACPTPCATTCPPNSPTICAKCNGVVQNITQCQYDIKNCNQANTCVKVSDKVCPTPCPTSCPPNSKIICAKCNGIIGNISQCEFDIKNCNQPNSCEKICDDDCSKRCPSPSSCPPNSKKICAKCNGVVQNITQCQFDIKNCNEANSCDKVSDNACPPPCPVACPKNYDPICAICDGKKETVGNDCLYQQRICRDKAKCKKLCKGDCAVVCPDECDESGPEVCARKGSTEKSFCNKCFVAKANCDEQDKDDWVIVSQGTCPKNPCVDRCPDKESSPICAIKDGKCKKFLNQCQFKKANCECKKSGDKQWKKVCDGNCPKDCGKMDDDCSHEKEGKDNSKEDGGSKEWGRHYDGKRSRHH